MSFVDQINTPVGLLKIEASNEAITSVHFVKGSVSSLNPNEVTNKAKEQLVEYFDGRRKFFQLPLKPIGTEFQMQVWEKLLSVGYGKTVSYLTIANALNNPGAVRAVGAANGQNPIAIIVPCHRVIGSNHKLTGYAGGVEIKKWLLDHEQVISGKQLF